MQQYFQMIFLLLSLLGYVIFLSERFHLRVEFGPAVVCTGISSLLFFAGILNFLYSAALLICMGGIICFAVSIKSLLTGIKWKRKLCILLIWIAVLAYFAFVMRGKHLMHYDSFSHWATVVKCMLCRNRMPNFQDTQIVTFQAYPLGSSLFIYYVCTFIDTSDACYMFAQSIFYASFFLALLSHIRKSHIISALFLIILFAVYALISNMPLSDLLVDTVMPLAAVAPFSMISLQEPDGSTTGTDVIWFTLPMYIFLVNVKNSGIFFAIVCWCYMFRQIVCVKGKSGLRRFALIDVAIPLFTIFLWKKHLALVYESAATTKHSMSIANYREVLAGKTHEDILEIGRSLLSKIFCLDTAFIQTFLIVIAIMAVLILMKYFQKKSIRPELWKLAWLLCIFTIYMTFLFLMYVLSMPLDEALALGGINRYSQTVVTFLYGVVVVYALDLWDDMSKWRILTLLLAFLSVYQFRSKLPSLIVKQNFEESARYQFQKLLLENEVLPWHSYMLYKSDYSDYIYFIARFELTPRKLEHRYSGNFEVGKESYLDCDYLILLDQDETIRTYLAENDLSQYISDGPVVIKLK